MVDGDGSIREAGQYRELLRQNRGPCLEMNLPESQIGRGQFSFKQIAERIDALFCALLLNCDEPCGKAFLLRCGLQRRKRQVRLVHVRL